MLHKAEEWGLIAKVPKLKLMKELGRTLRLDQEAERKLLAAADSLLERGAWLLKARCGERREGWVFKAFSASGHLTTMGRKFREARREAGLPEKLVLYYCGRHDYGTRVLQGTGNLAVVMRAMGHGSPSTAMKYQHPELEQVRRVLNGTKSSHHPEPGL